MDPVKALVLSGEVFKFLAYLKSLTRPWQPYVVAAIETLASGYGVSPGTVDRHLKTLRETQVPGFTHSFLTTVVVLGERRQYPVDGWGRNTVPPDHGGRIPAPRRAQKCATGDASHLKKTCARRYRSEEIRTNSPKPPERERLASVESRPVRQAPLPAVLDEPIDPSALDQPLPAVLDEPIDPSALDQPLPAVLDEPIDPSALDQPLPVPDMVLTNGQVEFLASLTGDQRAAFDAMSVNKRAWTLKPHAMGLDRIMAEAQKADLRAVKRVEQAPPRPLPRTLPELVEQLPGEPAKVQTAVEWLVRDLGNETSRGFWTEYNKILMAVAVGTIAPRHVINALGQATRVRTGKRKITNPGAKFWAALQGLACITEADLDRLAVGG